MDDWLTDIDYNYIMNNEGSHPVNCNQAGANKENDHINYSRANEENDPVNQCVAYEPIELLSQEDLKDFERGFSDTELI